MAGGGGGGGVITVVAEPVLLLVVGSVSFPLTLAVLVSAPAVVGVTIRVTVAVAPVPQAANVARDGVDTRAGPLTGSDGNKGHPSGQPVGQRYTGGIIGAVVGDSEGVRQSTPGGAAALVYSTYLGGNGNDSGADVVTDASGTAYVTGETNSPNFPTRNAFQPVRGGGALVDDAFVAKITDPAPATDADVSVSLADAPDPLRVGATTSPSEETWPVDKTR